MGNVADDETRVILRKLAWFVPSFYVLFYSVATLYLAALGVSFDHLGAAPFLFDDDDFKPLLREAGQADRQLPLATWCALCTTMLLSTALIFFIVKNTSKAWDYATTIAFVHGVASMLVNLQFPLNWIWWVTMAVATFALSSLSEICIYYLHDMKEIALEH